MEQSRGIHIVGSYLRYRRGALLCAILPFGISTLILFLCRIPLDIVGYAALLTGIVLLLILLRDGQVYYQKVRQLERAERSVTIRLDELPKTAEAIEHSYQAMIQTLFDGKAEAISKADASKSDMLEYYTLWAHQIKTPIAAMHLIVEEEEERNKAAQLSQELFQIEQYVEMVLQYLRMESMGSDLLLMSYSLNSIVRQAVKKYASVFIYRKIGLDLHEIELQVVTDEKWLVFVIEQLLSNGLKYTRQGDISIYLDPNKEKTLVIQDAGIGISPEDLPRIFEKGFTGYNGRMDKKSTGIGLYLCKRILDKLGHTIEITSKVGQGTRVELNFSRTEIEIE